MSESRKRITVNADLCIGGGQCVLAAPDLFDQDDDGIVVVLNEFPGHDQEAAAREAVAVCPARVIELVDA